MAKKNIKVKHGDVVMITEGGYTSYALVFEVDTKKGLAEVEYLSTGVSEEFEIKELKVVTKKELLAALAKHTKAIESITEALDELYNKRYC